MYEGCRKGYRKMVICPIARAVHCTGCALVKFCPAKTFLGDYGKTETKPVSTGSDSEKTTTKKDDGKV
jgi:hypothetical protein